MAADELENGNGNGAGDDYPDEAEQLARALRWVGRVPKQSVEVTLALLRQKLIDIGTDVITIRDDIKALGRRQDTLWNDYQQRLGRERLVTWWLAFLTVLVGAIGAYAAFSGHHP